MRNLTDHVVEGDSAPQLTITVMDQPGPGGANHEYHISWPGGVCLDLDGNNIQGVRTMAVSFQNGPIKEAGINGVTQEALLAVVIDRLRSFQAGPFASPFNEMALIHCEGALKCLQVRTKERIARGVEGQTKA